MEDNEVWRDIEGYEGLYQVSNLGRVKSLKLGKGRILSPRMNGMGYLLVDLCKEGKKKTFLIHRLVGMAFIPNSEGLPQINHKNEDKTLNVVFLKDDGSVDEYRSNLEWCDCKYNNNYGTHIERQVQTGIGNGTYDPDMCGMRKDGDRKEYDSMRYYKNREQILEQKREYRQKNKERLNEYQRDYRRRKKQTVI